MAKSISQAQADALADDFDFGGTSKDEFRPAKTLGALYRIGSKLAERAADNLIKTDSVASGKGAESIKVMKPEKTGNSFSVDITMLYYLQFIDRGVKGVKGGSGDFSFKYINPSKKMVEAIKKYVKSERRKARTNVGGAAITKREKKRKSITGETKSIAYAIARSIKIKGIKKTKFMQDAIRDTKKEVKEELGQALKVDVINSIPKKI